MCYHIIQNMNLITMALIMVGTHLSGTQFTTDATDRFYLRLRNQYLRICLFETRTKWKNYFVATRDYVKEKKAKIMNTYYDANTFYYSLPESNRELIEQLINLHF
jgi:hypothetical protein